jgi:hypothetical protein
VRRLAGAFSRFAGQLAGRGARRHTLPEGVASKLAESKRLQAAAVQKDVKIYGTNQLKSFSINKSV